MRILMVELAGRMDGPHLREPDMPVSALASALADQGHDVAVCHRRGDGDREMRARYGGVQHIDLVAGPPRELSEESTISYVGDFVRALGRELCAREVDVLHSHRWLAGLATQLTPRRDGLPLVHSFHGVTLGATPAPRRPGAPGSGRRAEDRRLAAERAVALRADQVVADTAVERERLIRSGVPRGRIRLVPPGVAHHEFADPVEPGGRAPWRARHRLVGFGAADRLVDTLHSLVWLPDAELALGCGAPGGPARGEREWLVAAAERLGVGERLVVHELDGPAQRRALIHTADVVVCHDPVGGQGGEHLEAMACGVPVVALGVAVAEAVVDRQTGLHAVGVSARTLARGLRELFDNQPMLLGMGVAGQDRARHRYSWAQVATETATTYAELVGL
jgi:glycosyltransferase involved in cell wall biosynthesis